MEPARGHAEPDRTLEEFAEEVLPDGVSLGLLESARSRGEPWAVAHHALFAPIKRFAAFAWEDLFTVEFAMLGMSLPTVRKILHDRPDRVRFAEREQAAGFPRVLTHSAIAIWSAIEVLVDDLAGASLIHNPDAFVHRNWEKVGVPAALFGKSREFASPAIVKAAKDKRAVSLAPGIAPYLDLLELVGLPTSLADECRNGLFELRTFRNVHVHRGGIADERFCTDPPKAFNQVKVGEVVGITMEQWQRWSGAALDFHEACVHAVFPLTERLAAAASPTPG